MNKKGFPRVFNSLVMVIVGVTALFAVSLIGIEYQLRKTVTHELGLYIKDQLSIRKNMISESLKENRDNVRFLYSTPPIKGIIRARSNGGVDPLEQNTEAQWIARLQVIFTAFMESSADIAQIRFIGAADNGRELVRVERRFGNINVVDGADLQSKGDREYFRVVSQFSPNAIYTSNIELNREFGEIQTPIWPTYRVAMPVFSGEGDFFGAVIINIDATSLLDSLSENLNAGMQFYLMNERGDFIVHPEADFEFRFEWGDPITWADFFGEGLPQNDSRLSTVENRLSGTSLRYMSHRFSLNGDPSSGYLTAALAAPDTFIDSLVIDRLYGAIVSLVVVLVIFIGVAFYYHRALANKQKLVDARSLYQAIVSGSTDAIIVLDSTATMTRWNEPATAMLGYVESQILGRKLFDLFVTDNGPAISPETIEHVLDGGKIDPIVTRALCNDGSTLDVIVTLSPLASGDSGSHGVTAIVRDISEQKKLENDIKDANASLEKTVRTRTKQLEVARNEALESSQAKSDFLAAMSHEIRTPMNGIFGMMNLLRQEPLSQQQEYYLDMAESSVSSLTDLINDILDMSKIEAGKLIIEHSEFDLLALIHTSVASMAIGAQKKSVEVVLDTVEIDRAIVTGDANRIRQILTNLVSNAIKFTEQGVIEIVAATEVMPDGSVKFTCSVRDTGIGISEEVKPKLFQAFTQESSATARDFGGTGLGLSISQKLCQAMGGDIALESTKGVGSTFSFHIVLTGVRDSQVQPYRVDLSNRNIELCMGNDSAAAAVGRVLEKWGGSVSQLTLPLPAEDIAASRVPELIVIDQEYFSSNQSRLLDRYADSGARPYFLLARTLLSEKLRPVEQDGWTLASIDKPLSPVNLSNALRAWFGERGGQSVDMSPDSDSADPKPLAGAHVLVADDHRINQEVANGLLLALGATVSLAENGEEVLAQLRESTPLAEPDVILMDCQMPVLDGFQTTRQIRRGVAGEANKDIPIIALTAGVLGGERERCLNAGMNDYLIKPVNPEKLAEALAKHVSARDEVVTRAEKGAGLRENNTRAEPPAPSRGGLDLSPEIWDRQGALKRLGHNEALLQRLAEVYIQSAPPLLEGLAEDIAKGRTQQVKNQVHQLKGISENIGALGISHTCRLMEADIRASRLQGLPRHGLTLREQFSQFQALLAGDGHGPEQSAGAARPLEGGE